MLIQVSVSPEGLVRGEVVEEKEAIGLEALLSKPPLVKDGRPASESGLVAGMMLVATVTMAS